MFFTNQTMPYVSPTNQSCIVTYSPPPACYPANVTNDPSMNLSSSGVLGMAYTAFTNQTPCGPNPGGQSEIAFTNSVDGGGTWSTPLYLGNGACDAINESRFPSAWMPSLTSLSNGTFVLAFLEYNFTNVTAPSGVQVAILPDQVFGIPGYTNVAEDRLVVTESYDGGAHWTPPRVLNDSGGSSGGPGWSPVRPWVAASGQTVYVVWANETESVWGNFFCPLSCAFPASPLAIYGSSQVHLRVSTDGGSSWGATRDLPVRTAAGEPFWAMNPVDLVLPDGRLVVAYVTNLSGNSSPLSQWYVGDVVVAISSDNGSSFSVSTVLSNVNLDYGGRYNWVFFNHILTLPELAFGGASQQLYTAFTIRTSFGDEEVYLANASTTGGGPLRWTAHLVDSLAAIGNGSSAQWQTSPFYTERYNAVLAVGPGGAVEVAATVQNDSESSATFAADLGAQFFGGWAEYFTQSTDNGTTFTPALRLNTFEAWWPPFEAGPYEGEYGSILTIGGELDVAWNRVYCPQWNTSLLTDCGYSFTAPPLLRDSQNVVLARLYLDPGVTVSFGESGLPNGTTWSVSLEGNVRVGIAPSNLSFSGVPPAENMTWSAQVIAAGYAIRYAPTAYSYPGPNTFVVNTSVQVRFERQYLLNVSTSPLISDSYLEDAYGFLSWDLAFKEIESCYLGFSLSSYFIWDNPFCNQFNYNTTPDPGQYWIDAGATVNLSAIPIPAPFCGSFCPGHYLANLTFLAWNGTGSGSTNTTSSDATITVDGPINESADYAYDGWCYLSPYNTPAWSCFGSNATVVFQERGLPSGTAWSVTSWTVGGNSSTVVTNSSNATTLTVPAPGGGFSLGFAVWAIPAGGGAYWWATTTPVGPVGLPFPGVVTVNFSLVSPPGAEVPLLAVANGLPNASTPWTLRVDGTGLGVVGDFGELGVSPGTHELNASPIYLPNGTGYLPTALAIEPFTANATVTNATQLPVSADLGAGGEAWVTFDRAYRVDASPTVGGTVSSSVNWVLAGTSVTLSASPLAGFAFLGWTGVGSGSDSSTNLSIVVVPGGPVEELASFVPIPAPQYYLSVTAGGLAANQTFTVEFAGSSYSGTGTILLPGVPAGAYSFVPAIVQANESSLARFMPTGWTVGGTAGSGATINVTGNGTVSVAYQTQYALTVASSGPGTTSPKGTSWQTDGSTLGILAAPGPTDSFLRWNGSGPGAYSGPDPTANVQMDGPITEVAQFLSPFAIGASGHSVNVSESGLPTGTVWNVTSESGGATGTGSSLVVAGLDGAVVLSIGTVSPGPPGFRYLPHPSSFLLDVVANTTAAVTFEPEFEVTILAEGGGSVNTTGGWFAPGTRFEATASPVDSGHVFAGWSGPVYNGSSIELAFVVRSAVTETAGFAPTGGAASPAPWVMWSAAVALFLLGTLATWALGTLALGKVRRRSGTPEQDPQPMQPVERRLSDVPDQTAEEPVGEPIAGSTGEQ